MPPKEAKKDDKKAAPAPAAAAAAAPAKTEKAAAAPAKTEEKKAAAAPAAAAASTEEDGDHKVGMPFRRFFYRGIEVHKLLDLTHAELMKLFHARARRRFARGTITGKLVKRLRKAKKEAKPEEKPATIKTHLRDMIIVPEMVASVVGVYNGLGFTQVEIKPDMIGHYLGEFSITYKPVKHGRAGVGGAGAKFVPLGGK
jgi:small subunit ribosomal protein S15e